MRREGKADGDIAFHRIGRNDLGVGGDAILIELLQFIGIVG